EKILTKVSITSLIAVRCTCKLWNALSKEFIVGRETSRQHREFLGFMMASNKIYPFRFDIQGIRKHNSLVDPSMKQVNLIDQVEISKVFHCDGLLLCFTNDNTKLLVWNPYVGQTRWIRPRKCFKKSDLYAIGYDNKNKVRNYKILRLSNTGYYSPAVELEIYDFSSDSWSVLDVISDCIIYEFKRGVSLKGCSYDIGSGRKTSKRWLLCFDYTMERYGQRLPIPYNINKYDASLSTVREENLAALYFDLSLLMTLEIWVTNKIEHNAVTWSKFFKVDMMMMNRLRGIMFGLHADICFADEENKVAVVITNSRSRSCNQPKASIIGEDGYFKSIKIGERNLNLPIELYPLLVFSPYIPSLKLIKMTMCDDLPHDLIREKILTNVPITSLRAVRCTCKLWNALSKEFILGNETSRQHHEFQGFMMISNKICPFRVDIQGIISNHNNLVDPSTKKLDLLDQVEVSRVIHCDGLLLCVTNDNSKLLVWNPYLAQTRWIRPRICYGKSDMYAIGYDNNSKVRNYKILRLSTSHYYGLGIELEIYDFSSDLWSFLGVFPDYKINSYHSLVNLAGSTYLLARRFGQHMPPPFSSYYYYTDTVALSTVREDKLAAHCYGFYQSFVTLEVWVTNKIEANAVSWSKFLKVDMGSMVPVRDFLCNWKADLVFVDEENKVAVIIHESRNYSTKLQLTAYIIREDGYFRSMNIGEVNLNFSRKFEVQHVFSPYHPSLVQINRRSYGGDGCANGHSEPLGRV
ncbi:hypothetical protein HID58_041096, partial [Brassica napus]